MNPGDVSILLQRLAALLDEQTELLRRIAAVLPGLTAGLPDSASAPGTPKSPAQNTGVEDGVDEEDEPETPLPDWVDQIVQSALQNAFSGGVGAQAAEGTPDASAIREELEAQKGADASKGADTREEPAAPQQSSVPEVYLLLVVDGETWLAFPWERVCRFDLAPAEAEASAAGSAAESGTTPTTTPAKDARVFSLKAILGGATTPDPREPYRIFWRDSDGESSLLCARLGGVVSAARAGEIGVDAVLVPGERGPAAPRLLPLVEYLANCSAGTDGHRSRGTGAPPSSAPSFDPRRLRLPGAAGPGIPSHIYAAGSAPHPKAGPQPAPPGMRALTPPKAQAPTPPQASAPAQAPPPPDAPALAPRAAHAPSPLEKRGSGPADNGDLAAGDRPEDDWIDHLRRTAGEEAPRPARSALLAVRYLPARVALGRALRSAGWAVHEALTAEDLRAHLSRREYAALFVEAPEPAPEECLPDLRRAVDGGSLVVGVRSRLRGPGPNLLASLGPLPQLLYPFQESEMERVLEGVRETRVC